MTSRLRFGLVRRYSDSLCCDGVVVGSNYGDAIRLCGTSLWDGCNNTVVSGVNHRNVVAELVCDLSILGACGC